MRLFHQLTLINCKRWDSLYKITFTAPYVDDVPRDGGRRGWSRHDLALKLDLALGTAYLGDWLHHTAFDLINVGIRANLFSLSQYYILDLPKGVTSELGVELYGIVSDVLSIL